MNYTFLLPAFKSKFFANSLCSLKNQKFKEFKCLVSDDCSPENLKGIFDEVVGDDSRFTYRRNEVNMGANSLVSHWNLLVDVCDTEYLIMASDDDVYEPNFLEEIDTLVEKYPDVDLIRARVRRIDENGTITGEDPVAVDYENQVDYLFRTFVHRRFKCIANYVFRTSALKRKGLFDDFPLAWGSDDTTVMKMAESGVCITPSVLFSFRISSQNISGSSSKAKTVKMIDARKQNLVFFDKFIETVQTDGSRLAEIRKNDFKQFYYKEWTEQIVRGCEFLPYKQMKSAYYFLRKRGNLAGILEKVHFFWTWWRARNVGCKQ